MKQPQARVNVLVALLVTIPLLMSGRAQAQPAGPITQVAAGFFYTCALSTGGGVACWGDNGSGQLGDNSTTPRAAPVAVSGLTSGIVAIAPGAHHTCALTIAGGVKCWGNNGNGQLGDNSVVQRLVPVDVAGLASGVAAITVGRYHACALTTGGGVKCWGYNGDGELGNNSTTDSHVPVDVTGLTSGIVSIAAGEVHTCAVTKSGGVKCWGYNVNGQLGDNSTANRQTPVDVVGFGSGLGAVRVSAVATGPLHTCALTAPGGVKCWGANTDGQLGDNSTTPHLIPGDVLGLGSGMAAVTAGTSHSCALTTGGAAKCWGANFEGQIGDNTITQRLTPVDVSGLLLGVTAITAGARHTCALTAGGNVRCWGEGFYGQVGDGTSTERRTSAGVSGLASGGVTQLALGESHTCALNSAGGVKCWGYNGEGELGNNSIAQSLTPVDPVGLSSGVTAISASKFHSCAVTTGGTLKCWGANTSGSLGDGTQVEKHAPNNVFGLTSGMATSTIGSNHTCALTSTGAGRCFGGNSLGVLGDGTYNQQLLQVSVQQGAVSFLSISAGDTVTCALTASGVVQCWGENSAGQLGLGTLPPTTPAKVNVPGNVQGLPDIAMMEAGGSHVCALTTAGGVKCWGAGSEGQLGNGGIIASATPVDVNGLTSGVADVTSGTVHTCAVTTAGGVKCWGNNFFNQLGDGSGTARSSPVDVVGLASGITAVAADVGHTCAITTAGGVKCWGHNQYGQLGDNTTIQRSTPVGALIGGQSIAFAPTTQLVPGMPVTLSATASSGLPVSFDSWTPGTCSVTGNVVTATSLSLCGVRASQAGTGNLAAAPQILRLLVVVPTLNVSASVANRYDPRSNGLLTVRHLFGLTGTALTNGALDASASWTDPAVIKIYLDSARADFDIDGNGRTDALTDGLLILRYMLGLRGTALVNGVVDPLGTRQGATDIEAYILSLMP